MLCAATAQAQGLEPFSLEREPAFALDQLIYKGVGSLLGGVANPVLMIGGLVRSIWSASQIRPAESKAVRVVARLPPGSLCVDAGTEAEPVNVVMN